MSDKKDEHYKGTGKIAGALGESATKSMLGTGIGAAIGAGVGAAAAALSKGKLSYRNAIGLSTAIGGVGGSAIGGMTGLVTGYSHAKQGKEQYEHAVEDRDHAVKETRSFVKMLAEQKANNRERER